MALFLTLYTVTIIANSPKIDPSNIYSYLKECSIIYDDEGKMVDSVYLDGGNRINVTYDKMPEDLINAVVSLEDKTFWKHHGFNVWRIFGAIKESVFQGKPVSGTSTITQQLARNVYLPETKGVRSLNRKISEAWYTIQLERNLSKKQILEAYLNTIYLGNNSYGVASAAESYFSKEPSELDLSECVALASIPRSPDSYALVKIMDNKTIESEALKLKKKDILKTTSDYTTVYNGDASKERRELALSLMEHHGYITKEEEKQALSSSLKDKLNLNAIIAKGYTAYFTDFVAEEVLKDLQKKGYTKKAAERTLYSGGLRIYSTLDSKMQDKAGKEFNDTSNFPSIDYSNVNYDDHGNIKRDGKIMLYAKKNYINDKGQFVLRKDEFRTDEKGNIILKHGKRLTFVKNETDDNVNYTVQFHPIYTRENGAFYSIEDSVLLIPQEYKALTDDGDLMISAQFLKDYPTLFKKKGDKIVVSKDGYLLAQKVRQPQGAMVICDYRTGRIKAMIGGRSTNGKLLYNRAIGTRQPGSSIKPLGVYSTALTAGEKAAKDGKAMEFKKYDKNDNIARYGSFWTAASVINDAPMVMDGKVWPKNAYNGYKGYVTLRKSVEQSINVNAVRIFNQLNKSDVINQLKNFGITSIVEDGNVNDNNAAALALGGMSKGISPLEMASAYGTFPNRGKHTEYSAYTRVENSKGEIIMENNPPTKTVLSEGIAFIMSDILRTTVTHGIAKDAQVTGQTTAGKTGTTSDQMDAWFCGFTPQYSAALWLGSDINLELNEGSPAAARMWRHVMNRVTAGMSGELPEIPSSVIKFKGEYFVNGTQKRVYTYDKKKKKYILYEDGKNTMEESPNTKQVMVVVCDESGYAATPYCPNASEKILKDNAPQANYFCPLHNPDKEVYPVR